MRLVSLGSRSRRVGRADGTYQQDKPNQCTTTTRGLLAIPAHALWPARYEGPRLDFRRGMDSTSTTISVAPRLFRRSKVHWSFEGVYRTQVDEHTRAYCGGCTTAIVTYGVWESQGSNRVPASLGSCGRPRPTGRVVTTLLALGHWRMAVGGFSQLRLLLLQLPLQHRHMASAPLQSCRTASRRRPRGRRRCNDLQVHGRQLLCRLRYLGPAELRPRGRDAVAKFKLVAHAGRHNAG